MKKQRNYAGKHVGVRLFWHGPTARSLGVNALAASTALRDRPLRGLVFQSRKVSEYSDKNNVNQTLVLFVDLRCFVGMLNIFSTLVR